MNDKSEQEQSWKEYNNWMTNKKVMIKPKYLGDKIDLLKELDFSDEELKVAIEIVRT